MQILILANHSGGLYDFRKDLITALRKFSTITVAVPRNDHWEELQKLVDHVIELPIDRRGMNPLHDGKLFQQFIPDIVAKRIVDVLEAIQIEEHQGQRFIATLRKA